MSEGIEFTDLEERRFDEHDLENLQKLEKIVERIELMPHLRRMGNGKGWSVAINSMIDLLETPIG